MIDPFLEFFKLNGFFSGDKDPSISQCYRMVNLRHLKKGKTIGNFNYFKPKKLPFWPFLLEILSKIHKIGDSGFKNHQNLKKILR